MTILDRYLLRQFAQIFVICFLSLAGLYVVIDAFQHLDSFTAYAEEHGSLLGVIGEYYAYQSFDLFDRTSGMLAMVAAMFTVTWLQRHQEMTAMMAAGISKLRIVRPIMLAAILLSILAAANREFIIPQVRHELTRDTKDLSGSESRDLEARYDGQTDILIGGEKTVAAERRILKATFVLPNNLSKYGKQLVAKSAVYVEPTADHPAGYLLQNVTVPSNINNLKSLRQGERAIVVTKKEAPWLNSGEAFVVSQLPFELLANGGAWRRFASIRELVDELNLPSTEPGADLRVSVHTGLAAVHGFDDVDARPTANVLQAKPQRVRLDQHLPIGRPLVLRGHASLPIVGGPEPLAPYLAAWVPLLVFVPIAVAMGHTFRT